jgi:uroporphyrinogen decarboxylase
MMTSTERVMTTFGHQEPDRVPFLLPASMHGARELGLSLKAYLSQAENVLEGQLRLRQKLRHDALVGFMYAAIEFEAWGGEILFREDGPPNSGAPFIKSHDDVHTLTVPRIDDCPCLQKVLTLILMLRDKSEGTVPVLGTVD